MKGEATPLYYAASAACEPAVDLLLLYGGDAQNSNTGEKVMMLNADKMDIIVKNVCCICNDTNKMLVNLASDTLVSKIFFSLTRLPM